MRPVSDASGFPGPDRRGIEYGACIRPPEILDLRGQPVDVEFVIVPGCGFRPGATVGHPSRLRIRRPGTGALVATTLPGSRRPSRRADGRCSWHCRGRPAWRGARVHARAGAHVAVAGRRTDRGDGTIEFGLPLLFGRTPTTTVPPPGRSTSTVGVGTVPGRTPTPGCDPRRNVAAEGERSSPCGRLDVPQRCRSDGCPCRGTPARPSNAGTTGNDCLVRQRAEMWRYRCSPGDSPRQTVLTPTWKGWGYCHGRSRAPSFVPGPVPHIPE